MDTEQLIERLSRDVPRVSRHAVGRRIVTGVVFGGIAAVILTAVTIGIRPDLGAAMQGFVFWVKTTYTMSIAAVAMVAVTQLARPEYTTPRSLWLLAVPALLLAGIGVAELAYTPTADWLSMWLGRSWRSCPRTVLILSLPIFVGLLWSFRRLAPTRLRVAGATAGLCAGAWAATIYCLHCPEVSAIFVLTWYTLGILLAAGVGALAGPRLLRW